jgi:hypothetical protein
MVARWKSAERERVSALSMIGRGAERPVRESTDQGSGESITLADGGRNHEPQITLAVVGACGVQDALTLHFNHESVNRALVLARVETHATHKVGAGLGTVLNQGGADCGADDGAEVHRVVW